MYEEGLLMSMRVNFVCTARVSLFLVAFLFFAVPLSAGRKAGVSLGFQKASRENQNLRRSPKYRQKILELNLIAALKNVIDLQLYHVREEYYENLSIANVDYENPTSPKIYYAKFQNFFVRLEFAFDPETYLQHPRRIKLVTQTENPLFESSEQ